MSDESGHITPKQLLDFVKDTVNGIRDELKSISVSVETLGTKMAVYSEKGKRCEEKFEETDKKFSKDLSHLEKIDNRLVEVEGRLSIGKEAKEESRNYIAWIASIAAFIILVFTTWTNYHSKSYLTKDDLMTIMKDKELNK